MSRWPMVALGDVCEIVSGATPKTGSPEFWDGDIPWVTPKDLSLSDRKFIAVGARSITDLGFRSCAVKILPPGSVLLSSRAPIGLVAINSVPMATNQGFKSLIPKGDKLDSGYIYHWLRSNTELLQSKGSGATFKELSKNAVQRIEIPLPPINEQRRIAAILDHAVSFLSAQESELRLLNDLSRSIFSEMFGDPMSEGRWAPTPLGSIARIIRGASPRPAGDPRYFGGDIPWLKISDLTSEPSRTVTKIRETVTEEGQKRAYFFHETR